MKRLSEKQADLLKMINNLLNFIYPQLDGYLLKVTYWNRTVEEQEKLRREGLSWTDDSKHLIGLAVDFALIKGSDFIAENPLYNIMGEYFESIGGKWGVWIKNDKGDKVHKDIYHFEYDEKKRGAYLDTIQKQEI